MNKTFGDRLKYILDKKGIKQTDLSKLTGIARASISVYIKGKQFPVPVNCSKIAQELDVSYSWLRLGEGSSDDKFDKNSVPLLERTYKKIDVRNISGGMKEVKLSVGNSDSEFSTKLNKEEVGELVKKLIS